MSAPLLVTGAAGFVGARFVESCNAKGRAVISVDDAEYFTTRPEHTGIDFGTVVDRRDAVAGLRGGTLRPGAVVHLGACTDTTEFDRELLDEVNLRASQDLWTWCSEAGVPLVYASSAATYGDGSQGYDDDESRFHELRPLNPYGESKLAFDIWALEQERAGRHPPSWSGFKFFNVYGFGERHKEAMASVVLKAHDQIRAKGVVELFRSHDPRYPDGGQMRDFVYVDDVVSVLWFALDKPIARGVFNLGTGTARTFHDLVRAVFAELGAAERIEWIDTPAAIRDKYQYFTEARMERLRAEGYEAPFHTLEEGVRAYVARLAAAPATPR